MQMTKKAGKGGSKKRFLTLWSRDSVLCFDW